MVTFQEMEDAAICLRKLTPVERRRSHLQEVALFKHQNLGLVLVINNELQHVEAWQALYHEPLVHLPASFVPRLRHALVLGGGDLFAVRELLKYRSLRSVTLMEHDKNVLDLMFAHYGHAREVLNDPRLVVKVVDARSVFGSIGKYDLVINDCFDLSKEQVGKGANAYSALSSLLNDDGVCSDVVYRHIFEKRILRRSLKHLAAIDRLVLSLITIPEYPGVLHIQTIWGRSRHLSQSSRAAVNEIHRRHLTSRKCISFDFYDPRHRSYFLYVPQYVRRLVESSKGKSF